MIRSTGVSGRSAKVKRKVAKSQRAPREQHEGAIRQRNVVTFDARHLFAARFAEQRELVGDRVEHLDKIGEEEDDFHFMIGQVATAADALSSLNMGATQQRNCGMLVQILGGKSGDISKEKRHRHRGNRAQNKRHKDNNHNSGLNVRFMSLWRLCFVTVGQTIKLFETRIISSLTSKQTRRCSESSWKEKKQMKAKCRRRPEDATTV